MHAIPAARYLARRKRQNLLLGLLALVALCMLLLGVSVGNGVVRLPLGFSEHELALFVRLRLPRVLMGALVGAGLAMSGTLAQAVLRNPLASPFTLGISSGAALHAAVENPNGFVCMVEGAIPTGMDNKYGYIGGHTMYDICKEILPKAKAVVNIGTCACYGGVQAAKPNPTGAKGVNECFANLGVKGINIPGCPPNPLNMVGALVAFLQGQKIELDELGRPLMFFGQSVHDLCERRKHFDAGEFAPSFNSEEARKGWCLYEVGCKGPQTYNNCPKVLFNETNWPVAAGHPCIGCSEPGFWDEMSPFYQN